MIYPVCKTCSEIHDFLRWLVVFVNQLVAIAGPAQAKTGSIQLQIFKAGFVVGVSGGKGTLNLANEHTH